MKRLKEQIKYVALLAVCLLSGCSDFLDSYNPSAVTDDFYNTKEGQQKLLTDINARYRNVFNTGELQYYGTDIYMAISEEPAERMFNGYDKTFNSTAPVVGDYWKVLYKIVQESNILLNRCTPAIAGNDYTSLTAQARNGLLLSGRNFRSRSIACRRKYRCHSTGGTYERTSDLYFYHY